MAISVASSRPVYLTVADPWYFIPEKVLAVPTLKWWLQTKSGKQAA